MLPGSKNKGEIFVGTKPQIIQLPLCLESDAAIRVAWRQHEECSRRHRHDIRVPGILPA